MLIRLFIINIFLCIIVQCASINTLKEKLSSSSTFPKQYSNDYDGNLNIEGSGNIANLDEYPDEDDDDDDLSKLTSTTISSRITTTKRLIPKVVELKKKTASIEKLDDADSNEFDDDYKEDLEDDTVYNEVTIKVTSTGPSTTNALDVTRRPASIRGFLSFLSRPPIAAGILGGLAIGIVTSVILLICIIVHFQKRERTHSSFTTGLLYPNQYGYTKTPQEFYA
ncbi:unnamed protein product [Rotaria magnacalcarata]|uniref:Syndecan n=5 Tax=Rotaria magnacalcarata TaxID=392030 RepID=A0A816GG43_9BILA|nr:unnamed protein product [Rotaria magnacalcarata]CAF1673691.1 unnamed protein product [Rotaria magnacalcarata]CAF2004285.1 unnamed protein product [Rotaria magnacalcarata]CAF2035522.1 unnamed protein product [Rotaria magnacalcarata]CAF2157378.1 unnamed protein product [Rotaria magnacalcarata]